MKIKSIVVFCGSSLGIGDVYQKIAVELGRMLAKKGIRLVYGGAKVGVMGVLADAVLENGGEVIGILPSFLSTKEIAHEKLTELILVETMHDRKLKMSELADAAITLPGGFGTMEEFFEILTWAQLGLHTKPIGILNVNGFYDALTHLFDMMERERFLKSENRDLVLTDNTPAGLLKQIENYQAPFVKKWLNEKEV